MIREPQDSTIPTPCYAEGPGIWNFFSSYWRNLSSNLQDGNSEAFNLGTASQKIRRLSGLSVLGPTLTLSWITEIEIPTSIDDRQKEKFLLTLKCLVRR